MGKHIKLNLDIVIKTLKESINMTTAAKILNCNIRQLYYFCDKNDIDLDTIFPIKITKDLSGQVFDKLTCIEPIKKPGVNGLIWKCRCQCGNTCYRRTSELLRDRTGHCCKECGKKAISKANSSNLEGQIINTTIEVISKTDKRDPLNGGIIYKCRCLQCGKIFEVPSISIKRQVSCGCKLLSKGEVLIKQYLDDRGIKNIHNYKFDDCKNKKSLPFDFAIIKEGQLAGLIEYDGEQHFMEIGRYSDLESQQYRDAIKTNYCNINDIPLLRIPYTERENIAVILDDWLQKV